MKKNKGFTLIELLAVIVILALLITIAVPSVIALTKRIKQNMYCTKVQNIETAAKIYGNDNLDLFEQMPNGEESLTITVSTLIDNNVFKKESEKKEDRDKCSANGTCVLDPRNNSGMDRAHIILTKKDKKLVANYQYDPTGTKNTNDENNCKNN